MGSEQPKIETIEGQSDSNISEEDIKNFKKPESPELVDEMMESVTEDEKKALININEQLPSSVKAQILAGVTNNIQILKEFGNNIGEKIDWDKVDKKKLIALGIYGAGALMGGVADNVEAEDSNDGLDSDFIKGTLSSSISNFEQIDGLSQEEGSLFIRKAIALAEVNDMDRLNYGFAVNEMESWVKYSHENNVSMQQFEYGLDEIVAKFSEPENKEGSDDQESAEFNKYEDMTADLPETGELEFNDNFSEYEKMQIQEYYDVNVGTVNELTKLLTEWEAKYGYKSNFASFENNVKDRVDSIISELNDIKDGVQRSDYKIEVSISSVGGNPSRLKAEGIMNIVEAKSHLLSDSEIIEKLFDDMKKETGR